MHIYSVKCYELTNKRTPTIIYIDTSRLAIIPLTKVPVRADSARTCK